MTKLVYRLLGLSMLFVGTGMYAQSRALPILELDPDARSAAMGHASMGEATSHHLYTNPSSLFYRDSHYTFSASGEMYPKTPDAGRLMYGTASAGVKFLDRHIVYLGYRYLGGLRFKAQDRFGQSKKTIAPMDMTYDLGYAFQISSHFSCYTTLTMVQSRVVQTSIGGGVGIGAHYRTAFGADQSYTLNLGAKVSDLGMPMRLSKGRTYAMPSSCTFGGELSKAFGSAHRVALATGTRYFFLPANAMLMTIGGGGEYTFMDMLSLRAGYEFTQKKVGGYSAGLGLHYRGVRLDVAYRQNSTEGSGSTILGGLSYSF